MRESCPHALSICSAGPTKGAPRHLHGQVECQALAYILKATVSVDYAILTFASSEAPSGPATSAYRNLAPLPYTMRRAVLSEFIGQFYWSRNSKFYGNK